MSCFCGTDITDKIEIDLDVSNQDMEESSDNSTFMTADDLDEVQYIMTDTLDCHFFIDNSFSTAKDSDVDASCIAAIQTQDQQTDTRLSEQLFVDRVTCSLGPITCGSEGLLTIQSSTTTLSHKHDGMMSILTYREKLFSVEFYLLIFIYSQGSFLRRWTINL